MSTARMILLALGAVIFIVWAVLMFHTLFLLRRRAEEESGQDFPGPGQPMHHWGRFFRGEHDRKLRNRLAGTTMALFVWLVALAVAG